MSLVSKPVSIQIVSVQDGEHWCQEVEGLLYFKNDSYYVRYEELEDALGKTTTTIKINENFIRVIRHGQTESEQTFILHQMQQGYYKLPQGRTPLQTFTHAVDNQLSQGIGKLHWIYDLYLDEEHAGKVELTLHIEEGKISERS